MPSKDELKAIYDNLKVEDDGNIGDFYYWSSTEWVPDDFAYTLDMSSGISTVQFKSDITRHTRAVRSFGD